MSNPPPGIKMEYTSFGRKQKKEEYQAPSFEEIQKPVVQQQQEQQQQQIQQNTQDFSTLQQPNKKVWGSESNNDNKQQQDQLQQNQPKKKQFSFQKKQNNNNNQTNNQQNNQNIQQKKNLGGWEDDENDNNSQNLNPENQNQGKKPAFLNKFKKDKGNNNNNTQNQQTNKDQKVVKTSLMMPDELQKYQLEKKLVEDIVHDGGIRFKQKESDLQEFVKKVEDKNYQIIGSFLVYKLLENTSAKMKGRTIFAMEELSLKYEFYYQFFTEHQYHIRNSVPIDDFDKQVEKAISDLITLLNDPKGFQEEQELRKKSSSTFDVNYQVDEDILGISKSKGGGSNFSSQFSVKEQAPIVLADSQNLNDFKKSQEPKKFPFLKASHSRTSNGSQGSQVFRNSSNQDQNQSLSQFNSNSQGNNNNNQWLDMNKSNTSNKPQQNQVSENLLDQDCQPEAKPVLVNTEDVMSLYMQQQQQSSSQQQQNQISQPQQQVVNLTQQMNNVNLQQQQGQNYGYQQQQQQQQFLPQQYQQQQQQQNTNGFECSSQFLGIQQQQQQQQNQAPQQTYQHQSNQGQQQQFLPLTPSQIQQQQQNGNQRNINPDVFNVNNQFKLEEIPKNKNTSEEKAFDFIQF